MDNMLNYIQWRGDLPLSAAVPPCPIDLLIFSEIVHAPLENLHGATGSLLSLRDQVYPAAPGKDESTLIRGRYEIWRSLEGHPRFADVKLIRFESQFVPEEDKQFAAALFLAEGMGIVAFRGTDATLVGWKEDFNMGLDAPVPAQLDAVRFLDAAADCAPVLWVCGHSKGGNLAMYASAQCRKETQDKIAGIMNFDGPGLSDAVLKSDGWARVRERLSSFIPESSVIGLLLGSPGKSTVVASDSVSLMQHNPFFWHVLGPRFVPAQDTTFSSQVTQQTLSGFLRDCPVDQRRLLVDTIFQVLSVTGATKVKDIPRGIAVHMPEIMTMIQGVPEENRLILSRMMKALSDAGNSSLKSLWAARQKAGK